jgi:hypothetical protein
MSRATLFCGAMFALLISEDATGYAQEIGNRFIIPMLTESGEFEETKTLKERLSDKASDEQRVDNCKVPVDRRGLKIRAEDCQRDDSRAALRR